MKVTNRKIAQMCDLARGGGGAAIWITSLPAVFKESVPVSSYQQAGIPADLKRKIAKLGINMLLKMVRGGASWVPSEAQDMARVQKGKCQGLSGS